MISYYKSYIFYLPLQLIAGLLFMVITFTKSKLCSPSLSVQLILQLRNTEQEGFIALVPYYTRRGRFE